MTFPNPVNSTSNSMGSVWYLFRTGLSDGSSVMLCETDARSFVRKLQSVLREYAINPIPSWDGRPSGGPTLAVDGNWGLQTSRALWAFWHSIEAEDDDLQPIRVSAERRVITPEAMAQAVAAIEYSRNPSGTSFLDRTYVDPRSSAILPPFGRVAAGTNRDVIQCRVLRDNEWRPSAWGGLRSIDLGSGREAPPPEQTVVVERTPSRTEFPGTQTSPEPTRTNPPPSRTSRSSTSREVTRQNQPSDLIDRAARVLSEEREKTWWEKNRKFVGFFLVLLSLVGGGVGLAYWKKRTRAKSAGRSRSRS